MSYKIENLVFQGGGILGIAYLGALDYLYGNGIMKPLKRVAGTSAGAITACIISLNLPFYDIKSIASALNYSKIPYQSGSEAYNLLPKDTKKQLGKFLGDATHVYRLIKNYGWFSTQFFYTWIKDVIQSQFDSSKKIAPYTFADFKNKYIHLENRPFLDLYVIGTNLSTGTSALFSYETTPTMEVAQAVRISMSIPLFFEAVTVNDFNITGNNANNIYCDGGVMNNYPINLFDTPLHNPNPSLGYNKYTLGVRFKSNPEYASIKNLLDYIKMLLYSSSSVQKENYNNSSIDIARSINIDTGSVSSLDFNIKLYDDNYNFLYYQGYKAAKDYFSMRYPL
ncbi:MAG: patatin-like phospholipase family protein [Clostridium sp.]|nr:patatin-like phospholipase family protein [Clostridium sp.]